MNWNRYTGRVSGLGVYMMTSHESKLIAEEICEPIGRDGNCGLLSKNTHGLSRLVPIQDLEVIK
jgi:hypothetical protein